ncbi:hypothetical protein PQ610_06620 [Tardisphaera miroshnichenkoae]
MRFYFKRDLSVSTEGSVEGSVGSVEALELGDGRIGVNDGAKRVEYYYRTVRRK